MYIYIYICIYTYLYICQSYISKGIRRQGKRLFCKGFLRFNTMTCRHMLLLGHFLLVVVSLL